MINTEETKLNKEKFNIVIATMKDIGDWAIDTSEESSDDINDCLSWVIEARNFNSLGYFNEYKSKYFNLDKYICEDCDCDFTEDVDDPSGTESWDEHNRLMCGDCFQIGNY